MARRLLITAAVCSLASHSVAAWSFGLPDHDVVSPSSSSQSQRRRFLQSAAAITVASWTGNGSSPNALPWRVASAYAVEDAFAPVLGETASSVPVPAMKRFVDNANPSYFVIDVPQRFFTIRRSAKGDLPDAQTGQGRRGGTIFTAGDMSKAEVVAVER
jgi:hypothetical protein